MTARELLELAAKAAKLDYRADDGEIRYGDAAMKWNPLENDGAALRLAVKLNLDIHFDTSEEHGEAIVLVSAEWDTPEPIEFVPQVLGQGAGVPAAATRRAIVMAAAEIGRTTA
jgi:hypothetical protein